MLLCFKNVSKWGGLNTLVLPRGHSLPCQEPDLLRGVCAFSFIPVWMSAKHCPQSRGKQPSFKETQTDCRRVQCLWNCGGQLCVCACVCVCVSNQWASKTVTYTYTHRGTHKCFQRRPTQTTFACMLLHVMSKEGCSHQAENA